MYNKQRKMSIRPLELWRAYDQKILIVLAVILTAVVAFRAGQTQEQNRKTADIDVSLNQLVSANPKQERLLTLGETVERKGINVEASADSKKEATTAGQQKECVLVGSKNSDKYHQPSCQWATRIKPENRVCFSSVEDARAKGYQPAKGCNK